MKNQNPKSWPNIVIISLLSLENLDGIVQGSSDIALNCGFFLKNMTDTETISWKIETPSGTVLPLQSPLLISAGTTDPYLGIKWPQDQTKLILTATAGSRTLVLKLLKPAYTLSNLTAVDYNATARKATAGQTLYLVKAPLKAEKATIQWTSNIASPLLTQYFTVNGSTSPNPLTSNKILYTYSETPSSTTFRINAMDYDKTVKVVVVDENRQTNSYTPLKLKKAIDYVKDAGKFITLLSGCTFVKDVSFSGKVTISNYNEEVKDLGIYYNKVNEEGWKIGLDGKLIACEFMLPGVSPQLTKWLPDNYKPFFIELSSSGEYSSTTYTRTRNDNFKKIESKKLGKINLKLAGGIKLGVEIKNKELGSEIKLTGKAAIQGGMDISFDNYNCDGIGFNLYQTPIIFKTSLELEAKISSLGFSVGPYEYERQLIGKGEKKPVCINLN